MAIAYINFARCSEDQEKDTKITSQPHALFWCLLFSLCIITSAAGPSTVATIDRSLWPPPLTSSAEFDAASRLTILTFAQSLNGLDTMTADGLKVSLGIKSIDTLALSQWKKNIRQILLINFNAASAQKGTGLGFYGTLVDEGKFATATRTFSDSLPPDLLNWYGAASQFSQVYCREQSRLAGLFSKVSSEISVYSPTEIQGYDFPDKTFLLTFDDGPSSEGGLTDKLIRLLHERKLTGTFFVLGENFKKRLVAGSGQSIADLYTGMNLQSHGMTHISHAKSADWLLSVTTGNALIDSVLPNRHHLPFLFRPPYGQRTPMAWETLSKIEGRIMLWNIDTQDWNSSISGDDAASRSLMLMLLWRRGIILFHDIHEKAISAIPNIVDATKNSGVVWMDAGKGTY